MKDWEIFKVLGTHFVTKIAKMFSNIFVAGYCENDTCYKKVIWILFDKIRPISGHTVSIN